MKKRVAIKKVFVVRPNANCSAIIRALVVVTVIEPEREREVKVTIYRHLQCLHQQ